MFVVHKSLIDYFIALYWCQYSHSKISLNKEETKNPESAA